MNDQPNASHFSARYAERKRAAQRARDAATGPRTCNRCPAVCKPGSVFCPEHAAHYDALAESGDIKAAFAFCNRTHWPEAKP